MSLALAYAVFPFCLACIVGGSVWLDYGLSAFGARVSLLPGLLGLITALGADSPEISSAVTAMMSGNHQVGVGVVIGSNLFNLAGLMGLSALIAGKMTLNPTVVAFNGIVSLIETGIVALLTLHIFSPDLSISLLGFTLACYTLVLAVRAETVRRLPLPDRISGWAAGFLQAVHEHTKKNDDEEQRAEAKRSVWHIALAIGGSLLLIVMGSVGIVNATLRIGSAWGISDGLIGTLVLALLTGLPNVYTSARFALRGKGASVISETLNSNTINMVIGIGVPAVVFGVTSKQIALLELWWLLGLTAISLLLAMAAGALTRRLGAIIVLLYFAFVYFRVHAG